MFAAFASIDAKTTRRNLFAYEMSSNEARMSVSIATIEFAKCGDGTGLTWTEQGAFPDGIEGPVAPRERREGTEIMIGNLTGYLESRASR